MTVIVIDPTRPDSLPAPAFRFLLGDVYFTPEVPAATQAAVTELGGSALPAPSADALDQTSVVLTTDGRLPLPAALIAAGHNVIKPIKAQPLAAGTDAVTVAVELMRRARRRGEWEARMTHETLLPYLAEESAEFAEAVAQWTAGDAASEEHLRKELSDVLLQVLFHAQIAAERGAFDFEAVAQAFVDKMASRAPYLFDEEECVVPVAEQERLWAAGKAAEVRAVVRAAARQSNSETS